jgi:hypothetical protein
MAYVANYAAEAPERASVDAMSGAVLLEFGANETRIRVRREQHDADLRLLAAERVGDDDAIRSLALREVEVGDEHVERGGLRGLDGTRGIRVCPHDRDRLVGQHGGEREPHQVFVLD